METIPNFTARCLVWYSRSIVEYMTSVLEAGTPAEQPHNILVVSHGAWIAVLLSALEAHGVVACREGVEIGHCLNTGVSIIEYAVVPIGRDQALMGTLVQYSGIEHLLREDLHLQEINADTRE
ncbi:hypothetical protein J3R82DRAFT_5808 [Butyriboletus roseoflavus]|nr:hypothetical protein J3R82DRAFT_5808 [Butyriboletus roseoflavus]